MSACPQCGTIAKPIDKFCNTCGTPLTRASVAPPGNAPTPAAGAPAPAPMGPPPGAGVAPPAGPGYGAPVPTGPGGYGKPGGFAAAPRCQMGHDIAPGASYCPHGHPIALDAMQFASDAYAPPPGPPPYGAPAYGAPPQDPNIGGYGPPPHGSPHGSHGYGGPPLPGYAPGMTPAAHAAHVGPQPQFPQGYPANPAYPPNANMQQPQFPQAPQAPQAAQPAAAPPMGEPQRDTIPANVLRGFIITFQSNPAGEFWPLQGGRRTVGRFGSGESVDVPLPDPTISSRHAAIHVDAMAGSVVVEDTGSTNGTFVNEEHIGFSGKRELRDGDRVRFGAFMTIVKLIGRV